ncbi:MAG: hypothetical protein L6Q99_01550 [Planctomycetes bacterium]|nr:hypothetical protein [Planctomycetota bacterium]
MSPNLRRFAFAAFALLALAFAWQGLADAAPFGRDRAALAAASGRSLGAMLGEWDPLARAVDPRGGHPLAVVSSAASLAVFGSERGALLPARFENLAWYLLACISLARFLRRFFLPWTGSEQAEAAGWAAALFFALSPLGFPAVGSLAARGDVLGLALGTAAATLFLAGRQDYSVPRQGAALALALAAGLASDAALFLAPVLALAEFVSARRQRPRVVRTRTTVTTLVVFGAATAVPLVVRAATGEAHVWPAEWRELSSALADGRFVDVLTGSLEKLGLVVLPINAWGLGLFGQGVAGVLLLVAVQPGLLAARTAPRLWSFLLGLVTAVFALALFFAPSTGVSSRDLTRSGELLLPAMVLCTALGAAATALSGTRRKVVPLLFAAGSAFLAHGNVLPWVRASHALERLAEHVAKARAEHGAHATIVVLDPPGAVYGVDVLAGALSTLDADALAVRSGSTPRPVVALAGAALPLYATTPEFAVATADGLVLLVPDVGRASDGPVPDEPAPGASAPGASAPGGPSAGGPPSGGQAEFAAFEARRALVVAAAAAAADVGEAPGSTPAIKRWFNDNRSPKLDVAPTRYGALVVRARSDADTSKPPRVGWRAEDESTREHPGVWWRRGGENLAVFDLASSLEWLSSGKVGRVWSAGGWAVIEDAELTAALPTIPGVSTPVQDGDAWTFAFDALPVAEVDRARATCSLSLLSPATLESRRATLALAGPALRFAGAESASRALGGAVWALELELDGRVVARSLGAR